MIVPCLAGLAQAGVFATIPGLLVGLVVLGGAAAVGRLVWRKVQEGRRLREVVFGVTDRRVLVLQPGPSARLKAYGREDLAEVVDTPAEKGGRDVRFAVDADPRAIAPPAPGRRGHLQPLRVVGLFGVPQRAARAVEAVAALPGRVGGHGPLRVPEGAGALFGQARGAARACRAKLGGQVAAWRQGVIAQARSRAGRYWNAVVPLGLLATIGLVWFVRVTGDVVVGLGIAGVLGFIAVVFGLATRHQAQQDAAHLRRVEGWLAVLRAFEADAHPRAACRVQFDLRESLHAPAYRFATSPHSKDLETYHRHRWARLTGVAACGTPLAIEWVDKVKFHIKQEQWRKPGWRAVVVPNPAVWAPERLPAGFAVAGLPVRVLHVAGRVVLKVRGESAEPREVLTALQALFAALPRREAP